MKIYQLKKMYDVSMGCFILLKYFDNIKILKDYLQNLTAGISVTKRNRIYVHRTFLAENNLRNKLLDFITLVQNHPVYKKKKI